MTKELRFFRSFVLFEYCLEGLVGIDGILSCNLATMKEVEGMMHHIAGAYYYIVLLNVCGG